MIEWLAGHGVTEVVLACGFLPDVLREALAGEEERAGTKIRYVVEPEPLGTAGAIRFAADELGGELGERFFALNGDVLTDLDLSALLSAHDEGSRAATIGLHPVEDSAAFGLVASRRGRWVLEFLEKTGERPARGGQRGHVPAGALGARPDPPGGEGLDRARRLPAPCWRGAARSAARRLLDGHRHAGALPAGKLGHPRRSGRDAGRTGRARSVG